MATSLASLPAAPAATINLTSMARGGAAATKAHDPAVSIDDLSGAASPAFMASISAPSQFSDPRNLARTLYRDYSILPDGIASVMQKKPAVVNVHCNAGPDGEWIDVDGAQNGDGIAPDAYNYDNNFLQINQFDVESPDYNLNTNYNAVEDPNFILNYANPNFSRLARNGTAAVDSRPAFRQPETLGWATRGFDTQCVRARAWRRGFFGEKEAADVCEMPLVCERSTETHFNGSAPAGFCPRPRLIEACERQPPDFEQPGFFAEQEAADFCEMPPPCEEPTETLVNGTAPPGFCPRPRQTETCERQPPDFEQRTIVHGVALAGICPRPGAMDGFERQPPDFDRRIAASMAGSNCRRGCAMFAASSNAGGSEYENSDLSAIAAAGDSLYSETRPPGDFSVIDLGTFGPDFQDGFTSGSGAWSPVETVSHFRSCTMNVARKVYARFLFHFQTDEGSPVPEPATWALALVGFIGLGWARCWRPRGASGA